MKEFKKEIDIEVTDNSGFVIRIEEKAFVEKGSIETLYPYLLGSIFFSGSFTKKDTIDPKYKRFKVKIVVEAEE